MTKLGEYVLSGQEINSNVVRSIDSIEGGGGGGGSSDFSTAILTFNKQGVRARLQELAHIYEGALISVKEADNGEYIIPVPANGLTTGVLLIDSNYTDISTTGNIVTQKIPNSESFLLSISGDCTITILHSDT